METESPLSMPVSAWHVSRPYKDALSCFDWTATVGHGISTWKLVTDWWYLINPGDAIKGIDVRDYSVHQSGEVTFVKRLRIRDMLPIDMADFFPVEYRDGLMKSMKRSAVGDLMSTFYDEPISQDTQIMIIGMRLKEQNSSRQTGDACKMLEQAFHQHHIPISIIN